MILSSYAGNMAAVEDFLHNGDVSCKFTVTQMENENIEQLNEEVTFIYCICNEMLFINSFRFERKR